MKLHFSCRWHFAAGFAQQRDRSLGSQCFESLHIPRYPVAARQARISGTVHARVLASGGAAKMIDIDEAINPILRAAVKDAPSASGFSVKCDGTALELVFTFVIGGEPVAGQDSGSYGPYPFFPANHATVTCGGASISGCTSIYVSSSLGVASQVIQGILSAQPIK